MSEVQESRKLLPVTPATLHILLCLAVARDGRHGYAIKQEVEQRTGRRIKLGPGTLYEAIHRLTRQGLIEECEGPAEEDHSQRRYYRLSESGNRVLRAELKRLDQVVSFARSRDLLPDSEGS